MGKFTINMVIFNINPLVNEQFDPEKSPIFRGNSSSNPDDYQGLC